MGEEIWEQISWAVLPAFNEVAIRDDSQSSEGLTGLEVTLSVIGLPSCWRLWSCRELLTCRSPWFFTMWASPQAAWVSPWNSRWLVSSTNYMRENKVIPLYNLDSHCHFHHFLVVRSSQSPAHIQNEGSWAPSFEVRPIKIQCGHVFKRQKVFSTLSFTYYKESLTKT